MVIFYNIKIHIPGRGIQLKAQFKALSKTIILSSLVTGVVFTGNALPAGASAESFSVAYETQLKDQDAKYSKKVMRAVRTILGENPKSQVSDNIIEKMPKVLVMDHYLTSFGKKVKGNEVRLAVEDVFGVQLDVISKENYGSQLVLYSEDVMRSLRVSFKEEPLSTNQDARIMALTKNEVMDRYIREHDYSLNGAESRLLINQLYGVNLDGISKLEHMQLGINSKGQWILKSDTDLFILESSLDDVEVSVYATPYFEMVTGSKQLPESLKGKLMDLGFSYNQETKILHYRNPTGESVSDAFKGQVLGGIVGTILTEYKN